MQNISENKNLFTSQVSNNYEGWFRPWFANTKLQCEDYVSEFITDEAEINNCNSHHQEIMKRYDEIDKAYVSNKIKQKKAANIAIIVFSFLIIGLFFMGILVKNKKAIKEFETLKKQKLAEIDTENKSKKESLQKLFQVISRRELFNRFLKGTGVEAIQNTFGTQIESYVRSLDDSFIGLKNFGILKAGAQNVYVANICREIWDNVVTSGSITVPYTVTVRDGEGNVHVQTRYETVVAYHNEWTPFRHFETIFSLGLRQEQVGAPVSWVLDCLPPSKKEDKVDYLKTKKISKSKKDAIKNNVTFEDPMFNATFKVAIANADGSISQQQEILTWFTNATQAKFVQMRKDFISENIFSYVDQNILKYNHCLNIFDGENMDTIWLNNNGVVDSLDYNPKTSFKDNVKLIAENCLTNSFIAMTSLCEFLNFTKVNTALTFNPIPYNYSLLNPDDSQNDTYTIDAENILKTANNFNVFQTRSEWKRINNFFTKNFAALKNVSASHIWVSNYYSTQEVDMVPKFAVMAHRSVLVPVNYERFHLDGYGIIGAGMYKPHGFDLDQFKDYLDHQIFNPEIPYQLAEKADQIYFYLLQSDYEKCYYNLSDMIEKIERDYFLSKNSVLA